jgi:hypothetical protein
MGRDADLAELAEVTTFGYPFGRLTVVGRARYPNVTVLPIRVASLRKEKGELASIQFDNPINPGNTGGPVLDGKGQVVAVARAPSLGATLDTATPVNQLTRFLATPVLVFDMPAVAYESRNRPVTWTIHVQPPTPVAKLPEGLSVAVTVKGSDGKPRDFPTKAIRDGVFQATVIPDSVVDLAIRDRATHKLKFGVFVQDSDVRVGGKTFRLSELESIIGGHSPRVKTRGGQEILGKLSGLGPTKRMLSNNAVTLNLDEAIEITVPNRPLEVGFLPTPSIEALVEARQGTNVLTSLRRQRMVAVARAAAVAQPAPPPAGGFHLASDDGLIKLGSTLDISGALRGSGKTIHPPDASIPAASLKPTSPGAGAAPLVRRLDGEIGAIAVGGAGRYLLLTLKGARKLAVFDVNAANVVKTLRLPTTNSIAVAGAKTLFVVFPDERLFMRWDLATLKRDGGPHPLPIKGRIKRLALGSDSDGPILAYWKEETPRVFSPTNRYSFIDLDTLTVLKVGSIDPQGTQGGVSPSGGSFTNDWTRSDRLHIRPSAGGSLFGTWDPESNVCRIMSAHGDAIRGSTPDQYYGPTVPGADGRMLFTGSGSRLDAGGKPVGRFERPASVGSRAMLIPSTDSAYYLAVEGLPMIAFDPNATPMAASAVTASVHASGDGSRLATIHGLDEMTAAGTREHWHHDDFTPEQRFHFIPAAHLLITIPPSNDRLVLRRVEIGEMLDGAAGDRLTVVSLPTLVASAGKTLEYQVVARSKKGGIRYSLARGPEGLKVSPEGKLTWAVPSTLKGEDSTAVVAIEDASGQEIFHTLKIRVE